MNITKRSGDIKIHLLEWGKSFLTGLVTLYQDQKLCNLTLISSEQYSIRMHSLVAYVASPWLGDKLLNQGDTTVQVDVSKEVLSKLVHFMYTGEIHLLRSEVLSFLIAARKLRINKLENLLEKIADISNLTRDGSSTSTEQQSSLAGVVPTSEQALWQNKEQLVVSDSPKNIAKMVDGLSNAPTTHTSTIDHFSTDSSCSRTTHGHVEGGNPVVDAAPSDRPSEGLFPVDVKSEPINLDVAGNGKCVMDIVQEKDKQTCSNESTNTVITASPNNYDDHDDAVDNSAQQEELSSSEQMGESGVYTIADLGESSMTHSDEGATITAEEMDEEPLPEEKPVIAESDNEESQSDSMKDHHTCQECHASYSHKHSLRRHMKFHGDATHKCTICPKRYLTKQGLEHHVKTHSKPYSCATCGEGFTQKYSLLKHEKHIHQLEGFTCDICGACCGQQNHLREHLLIHTGERKETCCTCGHKFKHKRSLRRHKASCKGTGPPKRGRPRNPPDKIKPPEAPSKCTVCNKTFTQRRYLQQHMAVHSTVLRLQCYKCGKQFRWRCAMKRHLETCGEKVKKKSRSMKGTTDFVTTQELTDTEEDVQELKTPEEQIRERPQLFTILLANARSRGQEYKPEPDDLKQYEQFVYAEGDKLDMLQSTPHEIMAVQQQVHEHEMILEPQQMCEGTGQEPFIVESNSLYGSGYDEDVLFVTNV